MVEMMVYDRQQLAVNAAYMPRNEMDLLKFLPLTFSLNVFPMKATISSSKFSDYFIRQKFHQTFTSSKFSTKWCSITC